MRLEPLYVARFTYPESYAVVHAEDSAFFFLAEGTVEGAIVGRLRGANHPRRRADGTFLPDFQGVIETTDAATIAFDWRGYGRAYPEGRRQIVGTATHLSDHPAYSRLNDVVCASVGEVITEGASMHLVLEVAELVWEPPSGGSL